MPWAWHHDLLVRRLEHPGEMLTLGRLGLCSQKDGAVEWLVREVLPDRAALAGAHSWQKLVAFTRSDDSGPTPWVESNLPALPTSVVVELFQGFGAFRGHAWGFVRESGGVIRPLTELVLPGPEMRRIPLLAASLHGRTPVLDDPRCSRSIGGFAAQDGAEILARMRERPLAVFGASRTGGLVAEWAMRLGIPLLLCDAKPLKRSHLGEISVLLGDEDVGRAKVEAFARRAGEWSLGAALIEAIVARADSPAGADAAKRAGVLMDCCDTDSGRLAVAMLATVFLKPQLSIATGIRFDAAGQRTLGADVRLVQPGDRCLLCLGGLTDYPGALRELAAGPPRESDPHDEVWRQTRAGSLRSLNSTAVGVGLRLLEDLYAGRIRTSRWVRIEWDEQGRVTTREPEPGPRPSDCPLCRKTGEGDAALGLE